MPDAALAGPPARLRYVVGDATRPEGPGPMFIAHVCNDVGGWGAGFVLAISARWLEPERKYRAWFAGRSPEAPFALGMVQLVRVGEDCWVANLIGQHDTRWHAGVAPIRLDAIEAALTKLAARALARGASVHMPRIGAGLAGGKWEEIEPIIQRTLVARGVAVTVYDLPPGHAAPGRRPGR